MNNNKRKTILMPKFTTGFTLIELLTVIAIIGFISVIVYANLQEARKRAQATKIVEEVNQLSKAFELYKTDKGIYPGETGSGVGIYYEDDNVISYLNDTLVNFKYIPSIPQYGGDNDDITYTYISGSYLKPPSSAIFNLTPPVSCGGKIVNNYIFIFENVSLNLNLPRIDTLEGGSILSGYCIGQ
jgi:prepilin-type N-terminal cleavage/methylation domain-containing protein